MVLAAHPGSTAVAVDTTFSMDGEGASDRDAVVRSPLAHLSDTTSWDVSALRIEHFPNLSDQLHTGERLAEEGHPLVQHPVPHDDIVGVA